MRGGAIVIPPYSRRRRRECVRCRSPTRRRRGTAAARRDRPARRAAPSARARGSPRALSGALVVAEHPGGQRRAEHGRRDGVDRDSGRSPFAAQGARDAVDRRFRGAIGRVAGGMAEQPARRRHQDDLAALALRQHLPAGSARDQPALRDIGVHHVEEAFGRHVDDLRHVVLAGGDDENVDAAEARDRRLRQSCRRPPRSTGALRFPRPPRRACGTPPRLRRVPSPCPRRARASRRLTPAFRAATAPKAPEAPVTIATLPLTENSASGSVGAPSRLCSGRIGNDDQHLADIVVAVDDLAHFARRDGAGIHRAQSTVSLPSTMTVIRPSSTT